MGTAGVRSASLRHMFKRPRGADADSSVGSVGQLLLGAYGDSSTAGGHSTSAAAGEDGSSTAAGETAAPSDGVHMGFVDLVSSDDE